MRAMTPAELRLLLAALTYTDDENPATSSELVRASLAVREERRLVRRNQLLAEKEVQRV